MSTVAQTEAAERILSALHAYQQAHGVPPSLRELAIASCFSLSVVHRYVALMEAAGLIRRTPRQARSIQVVAAVE